jgi:hypothetical protein
MKVQWAGTAPTSASAESAKGQTTIPPDDAAQELHDKATRGVWLSAEEKVRLEAWYGELDQAEHALLAGKLSGEPLAVLRAHVEEPSHGVSRRAGAVGDEIAVSDLAPTECLAKPLAAGDVAVVADYQAFFVDLYVPMLTLTAEVCGRATPASAKTSTVTRSRSPGWTAMPIPGPIRSWRSLGAETVRQLADVLDK